MNKKYRGLESLFLSHLRVNADANGNILNAKRKGITISPDNNDMDDMDYQYYSGNNKLNYINDNGDNVNSTLFNDIKFQFLNNYVYDAVGNLVKDYNEEIDKIEWNVYGKIKRIYRNLQGHPSASQI